MSKRNRIDHHSWIIGRLVSGTRTVPGAFKTQMYDPIGDTWADGAAVVSIRGGYAAFAGAEL